MMGRSSQWRYSLGKREGGGSGGDLHDWKTLRSRAIMRMTEEAKDRS